MQRIFRKGSKFKPSQSELLSCDKEGAVGLGIKAMDVVSEMGCSSKSHQEAHKVNSPIKVSSNNPISPQKPNPITKPTQQKGKPKLKRIARERGSQAHGEQQANLSGSKRPGKLVFSDDFDEAQPLKKLCKMLPQKFEPSLALSAVAAKQHHRAQ